MAERPILVIMAAGMGSRYGGLKQMDPIDEKGRIIIDYSLYDAKRAGFDEVAFVIKRENEALFRERIGDRIAGQMKVHYVYQELTDLPEGFAVPENRVKPWGTGHAVRACREVAKGRPFAVINADDYYGAEAFALLYDFLSKEQISDKDHYAMVAYEIGKTVTENGSVARGVCETDAQGFLTAITERTQIEKRTNGAAYTEDGGKTYTELSSDTVVSMNFWGFSGQFLSEIDRRFSDFLKRELPKNPVKCEYFLPFVVEELLKEGIADVRVLPTKAHWYGVTYQADKQAVVDALAAKIAAGEYPSDFGLETK